MSDKLPKIKSMPIFKGDVTDATFHKGKAIALTINGVECIVMSATERYITNIVESVMQPSFEIRYDKIVDSAICKSSEITEW